MTRPDARVWPFIAPLIGLALIWLVAACAVETYRATFNPCPTEAC